MKLKGLIHNIGTKICELTEPDWAKALGKGCFHCGAKNLNGDTSITNLGESIVILSCPECGNEQQFKKE